MDCDYSCRDVLPKTRKKNVIKWKPPKIDVTEIYPTSSFLNDITPKENQKSSANEKTTRTGCKLKKRRNIQNKNSKESNATSKTIIDSKLTTSAIDKPNCYKPKSSKNSKNIEPECESKKRKTCQNNGNRKMKAQEQLVPNLIVSSLLEPSQTPGISSETKSQILNPEVKTNNVLTAKKLFSGAALVNKTKNKNKLNSDDYVAFCRRQSDKRSIVEKQVQLLTTEIKFLKYIDMFGKFLIEFNNNPDVEMDDIKKILSKLRKLHISQGILATNFDALEIIAKARKWKGNYIIRRKCNSLCKMFKSMFASCNDQESFNVIFPKIANLLNRDKDQLLENDKWKKLLADAENKVSMYDEKQVKILSTIPTNLNTDLKKQFVDANVGKLCSVI